MQEMKQLTGVQALVAMILIEHGCEVEKAIELATKPIEKKDKCIDLQRAYHRLNGRIF